MEVIDRGNIRIEIWERGAGYTLASGSSSTAAAAVARKLGRCDSHIFVHMPGGTIVSDSAWSPSGKALAVLIAFREKGMRRTDSKILKIEFE